MVKVAVIGAGLMGVKIAGEMMYHGHRVKIHDQNTTMLNSVYEKILEDKRQLKEDGLMSHENFIGQLLCMSRLDETVGDADIVFEVICEELPAKQLLFEQLSDYCRPSAIIASNTLRLDIDQITSKVTHKERTLGIRFLYPVYYIPEVEITPGSLTSPAVVNKVRGMLERMSKTLFFRSGGEPLILSDHQREERKIARYNQIKRSSGLGHTMRSLLPALSHDGNMQPVQDDEFSPSLSENEHDCAICMDHKRNSLLHPCHHMVTCNFCAESLVRRKDGCPICRKEIKEVIKVYHS